MLGLSTLLSYRDSRWMYTLVALVVYHIRCHYIVS